MTNTEELIKIAIENGYKNGEIPLHKLPENIIALGYVYEIFLDREFFIALGHGLGWKENMPEVSGIPLSLAEMVIKYDNMPEWLYHWHHFIDHLAEGHSIEDYAGKLLSK